MGQSLHHHISKSFLPYPVGYPAPTRRHTHGSTCGRPLTTFHAYSVTLSLTPLVAGSGARGGEGGGGGGTRSIGGASAMVSGSNSSACGVGVADAVRDVSK